MLVFNTPTPYRSLQCERCDTLETVVTEGSVSTVAVFLNFEAPPPDNLISRTLLEDRGLVTQDRRPFCFFVVVGVELALFLDPFGECFVGDA